MDSNSSSTTRNDTDKNITVNSAKKPNVTTIIYPGNTSKELHNKHTADEVTEMVTTTDLDTSPRMPDSTIEECTAKDIMTKKPNKVGNANTQANKHSQGRQPQKKEISENKSTQFTNDKINNNTNENSEETPGNNQAGDEDKYFIQASKMKVQEELSNHLEYMNLKHMVQERKTQWNKLTKFQQLTKFLT